jgi:hypothetical protein
MEATELERRCAYHESGHTVTAVRLGIPIKFVTIAEAAPSKPKEGRSHAVQDDYHRS